MLEITIHGVSMWVNFSLCSTIKKKKWHTSIEGHWYFELSSSLKNFKTLPLCRWYLNFIDFHIEVENLNGDKVQNFRLTKTGCKMILFQLHWSK